MIVWQVLPGAARGAVILTHGPPGAFAEIWSPALPVLLAPGIFLQASCLGGGHDGPFFETARRPTHRLPLGLSSSQMPRLVWCFACWCGRRHSPRARLQGLEYPSRPTRF